jgi:hypothetical protein
VPLSKHQLAVKSWFVLIMLNRGISFVCAGFRNSILRKSRIPSVVDEKQVSRRRSCWDMRSNTDIMENWCRETQTFFFLYITPKIWGVIIENFRSLKTSELNNDYTLSAFMYLKAYWSHKYLRSGVMKYIKHLWTFKNFICIRP